VTGMTERLYYTDSSRLQFDARVISVAAVEGRHRVELDRSAFYPTSGGQLFDIGTLGDRRVVEVIEEDGRVLHLLDGEPAFGIGDIVAGTVDAVRRRDNMQKHTGQHILSRAFIEVCRAETVSSRLSEEDSTVDLSVPDLGDDVIRQAETLANAIIFQNRPVTITFVPHDRLQTIPLRKIPDREEKEYRIVVIENYDWSACGGTHCRATGSVGIVKVTGREKVHGLLRLHFLTGLLALDDYRWRYDQIERIANLFTRHGRESVAGVEQLMAENTLLRKKNAELKRELLPSLVDRWYDAAREIAGMKTIVLDFSGDEVKEAREAALGIINKYDAVVIIGMDDKLLVAVSKNIGRSAADLLKKAIDHFGGRGGGSPQLAQGGAFRAADIKVLLADPGAIFDM
jgi:alanyl-tRNA synthetase